MELLYVVQEGIPKMPRFCWEEFGGVVVGEGFASLINFSFDDFITSSLISSGFGNASICMH